MSIGSKNYYSYGTFLKEKFPDNRVFKLSIDAGFTCPNRDGTKDTNGCIFCYARSFTPEKAHRKFTVQKQIEIQIAYFKKQYKAEKFILYFQPFSNTYAPAEKLLAMYTHALSVSPDETVGLALGTRADCLEDKKLKVLADISKQTYLTVEIGMESAFNDTLQRINRQHSIGDVKDAVARIQTTCKKKKTNIDICLHIILGFPWETRDMQLSYVKLINSLPIQQLKIHQLHIVEGTKMAETHKKSPYSLYTLGEYTELVSEFIMRLRKDIIIQRFFAMSGSGEVIAPRWDKHKNQMLSHFHTYFAENKIIQGKNYNPNENI
jgi:radical SAM protein (TIGR01212 family)